MSTIALAECRAWLAADTIATTTGEVSTMPASNLKSPNLSKPFRSTSASGNQGFTWNFNNVVVSICALGCVQANVDIGVGGQRRFSFLTTPNSPYADVDKDVTAVSFWLQDPDRYGTTLSTADEARADAIVYYGIDTLDLGGPAVTGLLTAITRRSGAFHWVGSAMTNGYHQAGYLAIGVNPLNLPGPSRLTPVGVVELNRGFGYRVRADWDHLATDTVGGLAGIAELTQFVAANWRRPIFAVFDTTGMDANGAANDREAAAWTRGGVMRIESFEGGAGPNPITNELRTHPVSITFKTWEQEPFQERSI